MPDRQSSAVGFRLRGFAPPDLSTYPDRVKLLFWGWVTESALRVKDRELSRGWDKDGTVHPLKPATIKYRKSEVGPVTKTAPRLEPALARSRVRALLRGRAHLSSAELFWDFDSVTGDSFAVVLHFAAEAGHDVFGLSDRGTAQVAREALGRWQAWKVEAGHSRPRVGVPGVPEATKREVKKPIPKREVKGRLDLNNFTLSSNGETLRAAIEAGEFTGFRRFNARGEQWKPGTGIPAAPRAPRKPTAPIPPEPITPASVRMTPAARVQELSNYTTGTLGIPSYVLDIEGFTSRFAGAAIDKARAAYDPKTKAIYWNVNSPAWESPVKHFETQRKEKLLVDPRPVGVAHHEVGHAQLHAELIRRLGEAEAMRRYWELARDEFRSDLLLKALIKKEVSRVAALDKNEFVAEVYSGLMIGRTYSPRIMTLYDALGGVDPRFDAQIQPG